MRIPVTLEGFEDRDLQVETAGFLRGSRILLEGQLPPKGPRRNTYVLRRSDGFKVVAELRESVFDPVPRLLVDGQPVKLAEPLSAFQFIWSGLPLLLIFIGGAVGGAIGAMAFWTNTRLFRSGFSASEKYILAAMISAFSVVVYLICATLLRMTAGSLLDGAPAP
jgi:hypothetical protein